MTKEQFITLLENPSTINLNMINDLEEITGRFPYFQNAHLLLAKQYHGHQNIRFDSYLRKASAYAPDREKLFRLIKERPVEVIHLSGKTDEETTNNTEVLEQQETILNNGNPDEFNDVINEYRDDSTSVSTDVVEDTNPETKDASETEQTSEKVTPHTHIPSKEITDQEAIIANRLAELERKKPVEEPEIEISASIEDSEIENEDIHPSEELTEEPEALEQEALSANLLSAQAEQKIRETEHYPEESIHIESASEYIREDSETGNLSSVEEVAAAGITASANIEDESEKEKVPEQKVTDANEKHTFSEWLRLKSVPVIPTEHLHEYLGSNDPENKNESGFPSGDLIGEFIRTEPRIVPARSEFYSPGNMARKSAQEHGDLVSETLARIYAQQGNIRKAIEAYKKLSLKKPEKSGYFAALIKELEDKEQENNQ